MQAQEQYSAFYNYLGNSTPALQLIIDQTAPIHSSETALYRKINAPQKGKPESPVQVKTIIPPATGKWLFNTTAKGFYPEYFTPPRTIANNLRSLLQDSKFPHLTIQFSSMKSPLAPTTTTAAIIALMEEFSWDYVSFSPQGKGTKGNPIVPDRILVLKVPNPANLRAYINRLLFLSGSPANNKQVNPYSISHFDVLLNSDKNNWRLPDEKIVIYYRASEESLVHPFFDQNGQDILDDLDQVDDQNYGYQEQGFGYFPFYQPYGKAAWAGLHPFLVETAQGTLPENKPLPHYTTNSVFSLYRCNLMGQLLNSFGTLPENEIVFTNGLKELFEKNGIRPDAPHLYL